jgi:hypothetical protein
VLIRSGFDIQFHLPFRTPMVAMLHVHPSIGQQLATAGQLKVEHAGPAEENEAATELVVEEFIDRFGNRCSRFVAPPGAVRLSGTHVVNASETPDPQACP